MKDKEFKTKEVAEIIAKSMHKAIKKGLKLKGPVEDVLDSNFKPEASPTLNPPAKQGVLNKKDVNKASCLETEHLDGEMVDLKKPNKNNKLKKFLDKKRAKK